MLVLALLGVFAAAAPEALPRIPGTRLRLGMAESEILQLGSFPEVKAPDAGTATARRGPARYFGVPGELTCYIRDRRLERMRFDAAGVSRHSQDYVDGQLRRRGLDRGCERDLSGDRVCAWIGPGYRLSTRMRSDSLVVRAEAWPPAPSLADPAPVRVAGGGGAAATPGRPAAPGSDPAAARAARDTAGVTPVAARSDPPATPPVRTGPPRLPSSRDDSRGAPVPLVATLPDTFTVSFATQSAADVWPRIVQIPPLDYPERARRESIQGVVWVMAVVEPDGRVDDAWIEHSIPELDTAALAWIARARFAPCERAGRPCRFHARVAVRFTLH